MRPEMPYNHIPALLQEAVRLKHALQWCENASQVPSHNGQGHDTKKLIVYLDAQKKKNRPQFIVPIVTLEPLNYEMNTHLTQ